VSERPVRRAYRLQTVLFVHGTRFADLLPEGTSMEFKDVVPVEGVLRLVTDTGLFLLVQNRLLFLDATYMQPLPPDIELGETVTLRISREYARRKGLVA
jgi:hypothetical protein